MQASGSRGNCGWSKKSDKTRRSWSQREDEVLILCLKDIIAGGWKAENGFKVGYLTQLEQAMAKHFSGTDLRVMPHINSKIHVWKKNHGSLQSMLSKSGIGWNNTLKMIEATDEAWDAYKRIDTNARLMCYKTWPYFEDWCENFRKDRATGDQVEDVMDAVNELLNNENMAEKETFPDGDYMFQDDFADETENMSVCQPSKSGASKKSKGKKRKSNKATTRIVDALGSFLERTESRLGEIATRIGYEYDAKLSRKELFDIIDKIRDLTLHEKLRVSDELVQNTERLEFFQSLPKGARTEYVMMLLAKLI